MDDRDQIAAAYESVVKGRRSIRGYLPKAVPRALIEEVITMAMRAPSSLNTQPWNFTVVSGAALDAIRQGNTERNLAGVPSSREFKASESYEGAHRERQIGVAKQLFAAMEIARDDKKKRRDWVLRGFRQFDAPVSIIVTYDKVLKGNDIAPFDCGAVINALVNAAWSHGLGCVVNSQGIMQSPVVREHARIPDDQLIMMCVAMGWPDESFPANAVVTQRKTIAEAVTFIGFED
jgi:nitroreductase